MTTRFSLSELGEMLHVPVQTIRLAVDELATRGHLTAESFIYGERNWRIAPSDVKRIQDFIRDTHPPDYASQGKRASPGVSMIFAV